MQTTIEHTALVEREERSSELQTSVGEAAVIQEIQGALIIAQRFPRDENSCIQALNRSCKRTNFAMQAQYEFPRGGSKIRGPSIYFAREFARVWGNIRHGCDIIHDDDDSRTIRAWAWDLQTNAKVTADDTFKKMVQRKRDGATRWVPCDERDLRELTNRRAAISKRNCILELLPSDLVDDALVLCDQTIEAGANQDPDAFRKATLNAFAEINISAKELERYLGGPVERASAKQQAELRRVYKSIKDGQASWSDYFGGAPAADGKAEAEKLREKLKPKPETQPEPPPAPAPLDQDGAAWADFQDDVKQRLDNCGRALETQEVAAFVARQEWLTEAQRQELEAAIKARAAELEPKAKAKR